jgi:hypothetical protein
MGSTFQSLLDSLVEARNAQYRDDNEIMEVRFRNVESAVQTILEKLRDKYER